MKRFFAAAIIAASLTACEGLPTEGLNNVLGSLGQTAPGGLSSFEIDAGLREALEIGATNVSAQLGEQDGFFGDSRIRIPLPGRLNDVQNNLDKIGLSGPLDDLQLRMNRAAEAAMPDAKRLMVSAVRSITVEDAVGILQGGESSATEYLRGRTEGSLRDALRPFVDTALTDSGAYQSLNRVASQNGLSAITGDLKGDMTDHAVNLGLEGMFFYVSEEERKIRENPAARTTELLRKVFGSTG